MKLEIVFPINPAEPSSHLRENLLKLFIKLGFKHTEGPTVEWQYLEINEPAPSEELVNQIFRNL